MSSLKLCWFYHIIISPRFFILVRLTWNGTIFLSLSIRGMLLLVCAPPNPRASRSCWCISWRFNGFLRQWLFLISVSPGGTIFLSLSVWGMLLSVCVQPTPCWDLIISSSEKDMRVQEASTRGENQECCPSILVRRSTFRQVLHDSR